MTKELIKCEFEVEGMHCAACELVIEKKFSKYNGVKKVDAVLSKNKVFLEIETSKPRHEIREELSKLIEADGYTLVEERSVKKINYKELITASSIAGLIIAAFLIVQLLGIANFINESKLSLPMVFFIGVIASLSSCMAVVGGLVLSLSSTFAKSGRTTAILFFHISRLVAFFILGGVVGLIGATLRLTPTMTFVMNALLFVVMIIMGINLLDIFPFMRRFQPKLPKGLSKHSLGLAEVNNVVAPILLGALTFILPCGFTQSMQLYTLATGNFITGATIMFTFALGTLPMLALVSFASVGFSKGLQSGIFFKTAGFIIIFFALFNFLSALTAIGVLPPLFNL